MSSSFKQLEVISVIVALEAEWMEKKGLGDRYITENSFFKTLLFSLSWRLFWSGALRVECRHFSPHMPA